MPVLKSIKDVVVGQAFKLAGSPRDKAGRLAAGTFGLATHEEVVTLRTTIQHLEDQLATLENKTAVAKG